MKEAKNYLKNILKNGDICVLALSGGPDSMCLLDLLLECQNDKRFDLICVHVNHNTRTSCEEDEKFVKDYLLKKNVPLEYYKIENYERGKFTEAEGRKKRYHFFKKIVQKYHAKYLFTAHHADDLTETIVMRILRGSTLEGYAGLKKESVWDNINIIRPLIHLKKKEILEYMDFKGIPYRIDETNNNDDYLRNRIRHQILPILENIEPNYHKKILKFNNTLLQGSNLIKEEIDRQKEVLQDGMKLKKNAFLNLSNGFQEIYFKEYLKEIYQEQLNKITDKHVLLALNMIRCSKEKMSLNFPSHKILKKNDKYIWFQNETCQEEYYIKCEDLTILPNGGTILKKEKYTEKSNFEIHLNSKDIKLPLYVTTRKPGMKMSVKNLNGSKKISDILINSKIPNERKNEIPILVDSKGMVLWVLGIKKSKYDLEINENYDIIYKYIKKEGKE